MILLNQNNHTIDLTTTTTTTNI